MRRKCHREEGKRGRERDSGHDSGLVNVEGLPDEVAAEQQQRPRDEKRPSG